MDGKEEKSARGAVVATISSDFHSDALGLHHRTGFICGKEFDASSFDSICKSKGYSRAIAHNSIGDENREYDYLYSRTIFAEIVTCEKNPTSQKYIHCNFKNATTCSHEDIIEIGCGCSSENMYVMVDGCHTCNGGVSASFDHSQCNCHSGSFFDKALFVPECKPCPQDSTSESGALECTCGRGRTWSSDSRNCESCPENHYSTNTSNECRVCPNGYSNTDMNVGCFCPEGYSWSLEAEECRMCPAETYSYSPTSDCLDCPAGSTSEKGSSSCTCSPGYTWNTASRTCEPCTVGTFALAGDARCRECPAGASSTPESDHCLCPEGRFWDGGVFVCDLCVQNEYSRFNSTGCSQCPEGSSSEIGSGSCTCPDGYHWRVDTCIKCLSGEGWNAVTESCIVCQAGFYADHLGFCKSCPKYQTSNEGSSTCHFCQSGEFWQNSQCKKCPDGRVSKGIDCHACPIGVKASDDQSHCMCDAGTYWNVNSMTCNECPWGSTSTTVGSIECTCKNGYMWIDGECSRCERGFYFSQSADACRQCPKGSVYQYGGPACRCTNSQEYWEPGTEACEVCTDNVSMDLCVKCGPGYRKAGSTCAPCEAGTFSKDPENAVCTPCPVGLTSNPGSDHCICPGGTYWHEAFTTCRLCIPGQYSEEGSRGCSACPTGAVSGVGAAECSCPKGEHWYQHECRECIVGEGWDVSTKTCHTCSKGSFTNADGFCEECPVNFTSEGGYSKCKPCNFGQYWDNFECKLCAQGLVGNRVSCVECPFGATPAGDQSHCRCSGLTTFWSMERSRCEVCPADSSPSSSTSCECEEGKVWTGTGCSSCHDGWYSWTTPDGTDECAECPPNSHSNHNRTSCICDRQYYWVESARECIACTDTSSDPTCQECEAGHGRRHNQCVRCSPGFYSAGGEEECVACPKGSSSNAGSYYCKCLPGLYWASTGTCEFCVAGSFSVGGQLRCETCPEGSESAAGAASCTCRTGTYMVEGECRVCRPGSKYDPDFMTFVPCPAGTYGDGDGICRGCPYGQVSGVGSPTCKTCERGFSIMDGKCGECPADHVSDGITCSTCPQGQQKVGLECLAITGEGQSAKVGSRAGNDESEGNLFDKAAGLDGFVVAIVVIVCAIFVVLVVSKVIKYQRSKGAHESEHHNRSRV